MRTALLSTESNSVSLTPKDWRDTLLTFPSHNYDVGWIITVPAALTSWRLFEAIYAVDEEWNQQIPGIPAEQKDEPTFITDTSGGTTSGDIFDNNRSGTVKAGDKTAKGRTYTKHGADRANERGFTSNIIDNIIDNNKKHRVKEIDNETGKVTWRYQDNRGNTVITDEWDDNIVTVYSYPKSINNSNYIPKGGVR